MCFAPQQRALFWHLNFQKWSDNGVFWTYWLWKVLRATTACTFSTSRLPKVVQSWCVLYIWLGNVLRATTACTFSTSQLPKVVRSWCVLYILTSKCASHHNGVQFFISHLASWLRTCRFSEPTFRPSGAPNHWKNTMFRDFPTFSRICIFFLLTLSLLLFSLLIFLFSLPLPCSAFHLSILSEVWFLNFLRIYIYIYINMTFCIHDILHIYIYIYELFYLLHTLSILYIFYIMYTSSTAQGGGGSFKNRKPIGEVGCCEAGMAKRIHWWTERCLRSPLFSFFLWLSTYLPAYLLCIYLSIYLSIYLTLFLFLSFI